jgi:hypothetical protein
VVISRGAIAEGGISLEGEFCLMPKEVQARASILFVYFQGVVVPVSGAATRGRAESCTQSFWRFLQRNPGVFVVLIPADAQSVARLRQDKCRPSLGTRVIGAIEPTNDVSAACARWRDKYAPASSYLILLPKGKGVRCRNSERLFYIQNEKGVDDMDLSKVADLLALSRSMIDGEGLSAIERLVLAGTLDLHGQGQLSDQILRKLSDDITIDSGPSLYREDGSRSFAQGLLGEPRDKQFFRIAKMLGVRLRVTVEPADA